MMDPEECWSGLCSAAGCDRWLASDTWAAIAAAYGEPQRHYHTLDHIRALLGLRAVNAALFGDPHIADLAILLHDIVYDPARSDNEAASAVWARGRLRTLGFPSDQIDTVARYIELSRHDAIAIAGIDPVSDLALFLDLDLSILAAEPAAYRDYTRAIRCEYAVYPDLIYRPGRARVLRRFIERPAIYASQHFGTRWETAARRNIEAELRELDGR